MKSDTDRIERSVLIDGSRSKVWRALTQSKEFGAWFGVEFDQELLAGKHILARVTIPAYAHIVFDMFIESMVPEHYFAWRWHPNAVKPDVDYSQEPTTLVAFYLDDVAGGTRVRVIESGFDAVPLHRRELAIRANEEGWDAQLGNLRDHVSKR